MLCLKQLLSWILHWIAKDSANKKTEKKSTCLPSLFYFMWKLCGENIKEHFSAV